MMAYGCGLRVSELVNVRKTDIYWDRGVLNVRQAKGKKDRVVMLSEKLKVILKNYLSLVQPSQEYIFEGAVKESHLTVRSAEKIFDQACESAGIQKKAGIHSLRPLLPLTFWNKE